MAGWLFLCVLLAYFGLLFTISWFTGRKATDSAYYLGNKSSPWYAVAFGLIGDSLSGVTFVSVPGSVATQQFGYMQMVLGYLVGYYVIAKVLLPLYYKMNLTSIYTYLGERFNRNAQITGSLYFILSRLIGAAFRLYVSATVLQLFIFDSFGIPFEVTVTAVIVLILLYTYKGGIKTLVWTDTLQSSFLLAGVLLSIVVIAGALHLDAGGIVQTVRDSNYNNIFFWDPMKQNYFFKQFISGALIAIVMTGLDQNMMQKNLSMRTLPEAQKNIMWFSFVLIFINLFFVSLGSLLYAYADSIQLTLPARTDHLFPMLALDHLGVFAAIVFILGISAATFSSADSVLTTLTTSFCIDVLKWDPNGNESGKHRRQRHLIHVLFAVLLLIVIIVFNALNNDAVINQVFVAAGYTYGPLLGLFAFGILTKRSLNAKAVLLICLLPPVACYYLNENSVTWFNGYQIGNELLLINGILTFVGLYVISKAPQQNNIQTA
ncbi:MAG TPA: sodium:solute symporter [Chitinophagales bacterium]|nr:sodium:solute symporter [Chitinophagales bacterium]HNA56812.1 sodium:solute symporter [Chitinophagales bacterium]HNF68745.1 sodium:solute symporter [Chitinophagales bacterium]HNJ89601.1 sodium:solute symporter [Chitinophagales bacterium]HNK98631.1 sodium:solute symporter [Chitinophagales bacterium]